MVSTLEGDEWQEVSERLDLAAKELLTFEKTMIQSSNFNLLDSMSAVEIGDSKMDPSSNLSPLITFKGLMQVVPPAPSDNDKDLYLTLIRAIFSTEMQFLRGASVIESTHRYIITWEESWAALESCSDSPFVSSLLLYCKCLNRSLFHINKAVLAGDIYEEEDFTPIDSSYLSSSHSNSADLEIQELFDLYFQATGSDIMVSSLCIMMRLRIALYNLYKHLHEWVHRCTSLPYISEPLGCTEQRAFLASFSVVLEHASEAVSAVSAMELDPTIEEALTTQINFAYSADIVKLVQTTPVRAVAAMTFSDSLAYVRELLQDFRIVCGYLDSFIADADGLSFETLLHVFSHLSSKRLHLLARSLLRAVVESFSGRLSSSLTTSMLACGVPRVFIDADIVRNQWSTSFGSLVAETLRTLTINRVKLLAKLEILFGLWGTFR